MNPATPRSSLHTPHFSLTRWWGVVIKEFLQLRRDRLTFAMIVGIPIIQLTLFGYAINSDPKHMPTALVLGESTFLTRSLEAALRHADYFRVIGALDEAGARRALERGEAQFVVSVPADFTRRVLRGERPALLVEADATDPTAAGGALAALSGIAASVAERELTGPLARLRGSPEAFSIIAHRLYNPEGLTRHNIVPGLLGVILTLTTVMMTALAVTRERERGTMENLLASPLRPLEIMTGKIVPYVLIAHIQAGIILLFARLLFKVPFLGGADAFYAAALLFVTANLCVGVTISSLAKNQLQALQMTVFYFLPNILLSGFMFPFAGMPAWARALGEVLPLTHFNRLMRGILLKGNSWPDIWPHLWPMALFTLLVMAVAARFFKKTLD